MPDQPDYGRAAASALASAAGIFLVAAVIAVATGEEIHRRGGAFRTHTDAAWVLFSLSAAAFVAAYIVWDAKRPR